MAEEFVQVPVKELENMARCFNHLMNKIEILEERTKPRTVKEVTGLDLTEIELELEEIEEQKRKLEEASKEEDEDDSYPLNQ